MKALAGPETDPVVAAEDDQAAVEDEMAAEPETATDTDPEMDVTDEPPVEVAPDEPEPVELDPIETTEAESPDELEATLVDSQSADETAEELPVLEEAAVETSNGSEALVDAAEAEAESEADAEPARIAEPDDGRLWYVVHCYSGYENKVRHNLEQRIETMNMKGKIFDVVVPTEEEMEVREGKRRTVERRVFPGYILVQMIMDEDSWYVVRNTPGVTGFVGMGNDPTPLRPEEVSQIVKRMEAEAPRIKVTYNIGQKVRIIDGPFNDFIGTVDDIDMDKAKVRVMVSFFGRETPVELDFLQVEKA